jgi:nucleoside-diphosphate-sugar epimerase
MRVFVAGASGAIGRPLVRRLIEAGHEVTGMTRHEERADEIRDAGADATVCDVFDPAALSAAVGAARPGGSSPRASPSSTRRSARGWSMRARR